MCISDFVLLRQKYRGKKKQHNKNIVVKLSTKIHKIHNCLCLRLCADAIYSVYCNSYSV